MKAEQLQQEALYRATCGRSTANWGPIINGFLEKGIPIDDIRPRENILTFQAWKALGRHVKRGEHGVPVITWIPIGPTSREFQADTAAAENGQTVKARPHCRPRTATVFHVSQTEPDANPESKSAT